MATKAKKATVVESPVEAVDVEVVEAAEANPFAALLAPAAAPAAPAAPAAAAPKGCKARAAVVLAAAAPSAANTVGVALVALPPSLVLKAANPAYPAQVAAATYALGAKLQGGACPARGTHDRAVVALLHSLAWPAAGTALHTAGVPYHSTAAYIKRGWLVAA